jgi:hypothetical protein
MTFMIIITLFHYLLFPLQTNKNRDILPAISHLINVHKVICSLVVSTEYWIKGIIV